MSDLKPCPFCGSTEIEVVFHTEGGAQARCDSCGGRGTWEISSDDAATAWNRRKTEQRAEQAEAALSCIKSVIDEHRTGIYVEKVLLINSILKVIEEYETA